MSLVRLAHFSDIHVSTRPLGWRPRDLFTKRTTGWLHLKLGRGQRFANATTILAAMQADIAQRSIDHRIFSGDATSLGYPAEAERAAKSVDLTLPGLAVPGNHDYYVRSAVRAGSFERCFAPWQRGERVGADIYPFAQQAGQVWLIGVNSARSNFLVWDARGGVGSAQMERLRELAKRLSPGPRILVTHYPLYLSSGKPEHYWRGMRDGQTFRDLAIECGISLWLHGHRHTGYVLPATAEHPFPIICAGSATQAGRASWNEYTIDGQRLSMVKRAWDPRTSHYIDTLSAELELPG